mgnify:CR=1 FL=1
MHLWMMRVISLWEILPNSSLIPRQSTHLFILLAWPLSQQWYVSYWDILLLYSDTDADEICIDGGGIVYSAHVGEYFNTYTGYGSIVRLYERTFRRGGFDIRYGI